MLEFVGTFKLENKEKVMGRWLLIMILLVVLVMGTFSPVLAQRPAGCIPASIMLHSKDRYLLTDWLIPWLLDNGYTTITYRDYAAILRGEREMPEKAVILSIDDISTSHINGYFVAMVEALHDAGMVAVLAINDTVGPEENGETYGQIATWSSWGMELATHTSHHVNLPVYSDEEVRTEIVGSLDRIQMGTGVRPITLILPYGAGANDERVLAVSLEAGIQFIVGIPGRDRSIDGFAPPMYMPRVGPPSQYLDSITWEIENWYRFNPECE